MSPSSFQEWLHLILGSICCGLAIIQFLGSIWCFLELRSKWRTAPELYGIDWLDIVIRVEREFGIILNGSDLEKYPPIARTDLTAGQLWEVVTERLKGKGSAISEDGWTRLAKTLGESLNVKQGKITLESRLGADLGMRDDLI